jgi:hypothetical protein
LFNLAIFVEECKLLGFSVSNFFTHPIIFCANNLFTALFKTSFSGLTFPLGDRARLLLFTFKSSSNLAESRKINDSELRSRSHSLNLTHSLISSWFPDVILKFMNFQKIYQQIYTSNCHPFLVSKLEHIPQFLCPCLQTNFLTSMTVLKHC